MFGVGLPEMAVIIVVALLVFGPDRLPEFARQAGRIVRQIKKFSDNARDDIRAELAAWDEADAERPNATKPEDLRPGLRPLAKGERPPYDADAT